ncbi:hypothetical protein PIB19_05925 [Sphingomonas sp. 7/4-4]|uniref:hypothetical protein n=1 Tax=Sphingomonas sp. 7/4-4 TaxID=3018446 RepID=UPI0022F40112|nr:hypothetical protein [Sphingomonas sp. 7/4-4]WBY08934.1 hypothetical protein PIB19_05925 [Sphingomonas sp. 7/4-4]
MLGQIVAAQFDLEAVVAELSRTGGNPGDAQNQLQFLSSLQRTVGTANPVALAQMRSEIAATVSAAQAVAAQGRTAASPDDKTADLAETTANTRRTIGDISEKLFERKVLDPYLTFASPEDEAEFRRREAERQEYVRRELAKGTPEGALNASNAAVAQLEDARDHGADRSPDFDTLLSSATVARDQQRAAITNAGVSTSTNNQEATNTPQPTSSANSSTELDDVAATLLAAGVSLPTMNSAPLNAHGLSDVASLGPATTSRTV